jgi:hypothetical protein
MKIFCILYKMDPITDSAYDTHGRSISSVHLSLTEHTSKKSNKLHTQNSNKNIKQNGGTANNNHKTKTKKHSSLNDDGDEDPLNHVSDILIDASFMTQFNRVISSTNNMVGGFKKKKQETSKLSHKKQTSNNYEVTPVIKNKYDIQTYQVRNLHNDTQISNTKKVDSVTEKTKEKPETENSTTEINKSTTNNTKSTTNNTEDDSESISDISSESSSSISEQMNKKGGTKRKTKNLTDYTETISESDDDYSIFTSGKDN